MGTSVNHLYEFGAFQLDPPERLLLCDGQPIPMPPKAFYLLVVLVERSGHLVEKDELLKAVWPGSFVEEGNLSVTISVLRKALNDDRGMHKYIETVSKRGYRFVADVREIGEPESVPALPQPIEAQASIQDSTRGLRAWIAGLSRRGGWCPPGRSAAVPDSRKQAARSAPGSRARRRRRRTSGPRRAVP